MIPVNPFAALFRRKCSASGRDSLWSNSQAVSPKWKHGWSGDACRTRCRPFAEGATATLNEALCSDSVLGWNIMSV